MATKIYAVAFYVVNKCSADICAGYIQYLLYYAQAFSLALYDKELFQEECGINTQQKPYLKLYEGMIRCGIHTLEGVDECLEAEEKNLIDAVIESFLWYGPKAMQAMSTYEKSLTKISRDKYNNKIIAKESIKAYFKDAVSQYNIVDLKSIHNYPDRKFSELRELYE
jgi:hypothetical protein